MTTTLITQFELTLTHGYVSLCLRSPGGRGENGKAEEIEVARVCLAPALFREFSRVCAEVSAAAEKLSGQAWSEPRSFIDAADQDSAKVVELPRPRC